MPWRSTSSTTRKACSMEVVRSTTCNRRSLGMLMSVSTLSLSSKTPSSATWRRLLPSKENGLVTTPTVSAPISLAICATTGAAPVPVPPPMPAHNEDHVGVLERVVQFRAALRPPPACRPGRRRPRPGPCPVLMRLLAWLANSDCASVLTQMNSTPRTPASIMRFTALVPPPPTPTTLIQALASSSSAWSLGSSCPSIQPDTSPSMKSPRPASVGTPA